MDANGDMNISKYISLDLGVKIHDNNCKHS